ncbi:hypothetical protein KB206_01960 [Microvirga sp. STS02]|uniref:hypothetical protein n=1 Tax=Hymenobacter negativus TaxID=2795026 RepID=UPI0018DE5C49|nr:MULTISPECIES: hypothetical protein [Bacteria]MBH8567630.1 hypothetical protein [Hymenobacter negativus]MBR7207364.1 hypothetical protein [Microvirga sp. STS02]
MKHLLLSCLLLAAAIPARAQYLSLHEGEYLDTTTTRNPACAKAMTLPYFAVDGKYPRSSATLVREATAFLQRSTRKFSGSGYVTFRFVIDCAGFRQPMTQVLQTDAQYVATHFRPELVNELYAFLKTLKDWRVATHSGHTVSYFTYLTFKLTDGKVVAVIP